jgi:hypothetical protein
MRKTLIALALISVLAAACADAAAPAEPTGEAPAPTEAPTTPQPTPAVEERSEAQAAAIAQLAEALGLSADQITVVSTKAVEWPDSCLGIAYANARCAQVITPGYRLVLAADGKDYEYRTNEDGTNVAAAVPSLSWHREGGIAGFLDDLYVSGFGEARASSRLNGEVSGELTEAELAQLNEWSAQYGSVVIEMSNPNISDDMPVVLVLNGLGTGQPGEAEQQAMLAWAQGVFDRLNS